MRKAERWELVVDRGMTSAVPCIWYWPKKKRVGQEVIMAFRGCVREPDK